MSKRSEKIPMNLQFFAEPSDEAQDNPTPSDEAQDNPTPSDEAQDNPTPSDEVQDTKKEQDKEPTVQELIAELARVKRAQEKAASEAAEYKKKYNAKLSEKEKIDLEKAEREAEKEEQFQQLVRENKINKVEKSYLALGYTPEEASKMAIAEVDEDFDTKLKIQLAVQKRQKKEYEAEFIKSRPQLNAGTGDKQITKEQFDNMSMTELSKLYRENKAEYDRLKGLK